MAEDFNWMDKDDIEVARQIFEGQRSFREDETFSDVVVVVENQEFPCHRVILAASSEYFKAALTCDMREARERRITLQGIPEGVFSTILDSFYSGKSVVTELNLFDVWPAADMLQISFITEQCVTLCREVLGQKLSSANCVYYLCRVGRLHTPTRLRILEYICRHFTDVDIQERARLFTLEEVSHILTNEELVVTSEDDTVQFLLKWLEGNRDSIGGSADPSCCQEDVRNDTRDASEVVTLWRDSRSRSGSPCGFADVFECTRYLNISGSFLHGTLASHPLVRASPRCLALVQKITWYQSQPSLHQTWCPPAAIHRHTSEMTNVLLMCQLDYQGQLTSFDLETMEWRQTDLESIDNVVPFADILYYDSGLYVVSGDSIRVCLPALNSWLTVSGLSGTGLKRVVNESLYVYTCENVDNGMQICRHELLKFSQLLNIRPQRRKTLRGIGRRKLNGMRIREVTHIGVTEIIFCSKEDANSYTIFTTSESCSSYNTYPDQLGSSSRLVTLRHDREVFVLQENGTLWRIRLGDKLPGISITRELALWQTDISLNGAVFYNDQLLIIGDFNFRETTSSTMHTSLPGVFRSVRRIKSFWTSEDGCPGTTLAVLPKSLLGSSRGLKH